MAALEGFGAKNVWNAVKDTGRAVINTGNALQQDLHALWGEQEERNVSSWKFFHLRKEASNHPYIMAIEAVAISALAQQVATLTFYLITTTVGALSLLFAGCVVIGFTNANDRETLLNSLDEPFPGFIITNKVKNAWDTVQAWLNPEGAQGQREEETGDADGTGAALQPATDAASVPEMVTSPKAPKNLQKSASAVPPSTDENGRSESSTRPTSPPPPIRVADLPKGEEKKDQ